jgi:hypothetical protein
MVLAAAPASAGEGRYLFDVVAKEPYRTSWSRLIQPLRKAEPWLVQAQGVASPAEMITVDGATFEVFSLCKPHDCADNQMKALFSAGGARAYGMFRSLNGIQVFGQPNTTQLKALLTALN